MWGVSMARVVFAVVESCVCDLPQDWPTILNWTLVWCIHFPLLSWGSCRPLEHVCCTRTLRWLREPKWFICFLAAAKLCGELYSWEFEIGEDRICIGVDESKTLGLVSLPCPSVSWLPKNGFRLAVHWQQTGFDSKIAGRLEFLKSDPPLQ